MAPRTARRAPPGWWRRNAVVSDQAREDARLRPYLTRREKLARSAAVLPLAAAGAALSVLQGLAPALPRLYLLLGAAVWVLATAWLIATVNVRQRRRARERRRADLAVRRATHKQRAPRCANARGHPAQVTSGEVRSAQEKRSC